MMVRVLILPALTAALLVSCGRSTVDTTALEKRASQLEDRFHASRQMVDVRRCDLAQLERDRTALARDIRAVRDELDVARTWIKGVRRTHALNDQDLPIDDRIAAKGLELGDVQIGGMMFRHAVVTAWDGDLLTFTHEDGIARVLIANTLPSVQETMNHAKPTGPRQPRLVINPSTFVEPLPTSDLKRRPPARAVPVLLPVGRRLCQDRSPAHAARPLMLWDAGLFAQWFDRRLPHHWQK